MAGILTDQVLVRRLFQSGGGAGLAGPTVPGDSATNGNGPPEDWGSPRHFINTPEDAANSLQFNAMLLGPYQVEVLFVLCTLLGGRRKLDAQDTLNRLGMIPVLDDMFQRLLGFKNELLKKKREGGLHAIAQEILKQEQKKQVQTTIRQRAKKQAALGFWGKLLKGFKEWGSLLYSFFPSWPWYSQN